MIDEKVDQEVNPDDPAIEEALMSDDLRDKLIIDNLGEDSQDEQGQEENESKKGGDIMSEEKGKDQEVLKNYSINLKEKDNIRDHKTIKEIYNDLENNTVNEATLTITVIEKYTININASECYEKGISLEQFAKNISSKIYVELIKRQGITQNENKANENENETNSKFNILDPLMQRLGITEVIESETTSNDGENSQLSSNVKLKYKGMDLGLDIEEYRKANNEDRQKMLESAIGEIDKKINEKENNEKNYMTIAQLVDMSVDYYKKLEGKGFNTFILNGVEINIDEWAQKLTKDGIQPDPNKLKEEILKYSIEIIQKTHGKDPEEKKMVNEEERKKREGERNNKEGEKDDEHKAPEPKPEAESPKPEEDSPKPEAESPKPEDPKEEEKEETPKEDEKPEIDVEKAKELYRNGKKFISSGVSQLKKELKSDIASGARVGYLKQKSTEKVAELLGIPKEERDKLSAEEIDRMKREKKAKFVENYKNLVIYESAMEKLNKGSAAEKEEALKTINGLGEEAIKSALTQKAEVAMIVLMDELSGAKSRFPSFEDGSKNGKYLETYMTFAETFEKHKKSKEACERLKAIEQNERRLGDNALQEEGTARSERKTGVKACRKMFRELWRLRHNPVRVNQKEKLEEIINESAYKFLLERRSDNPNGLRYDSAELKKVIKMMSVDTLIEPKQLKELKEMIPQEREEEAGEIE